MNRQVYENIDEEIYFKELESGLKVYYVPKLGYKKQYALFSTNYGSIDRTFKKDGELIKLPDGTAHFLEHKLFEEPDKNISEQFSDLGLEANAFTNFSQTSYLFSGTENFYEGLELLVKFVQNPYFTDENVEKEKGIIEQEIKMYDDMAPWKVFFNCMNGMYNKHPIKIDIAGTVESIGEINRDELYKAYNTFYHPNNMVLFIIGDLDFDEIIGLIESVERKDYEEFEVERIMEEENDDINRGLVEESMLTSRPVFNIGVKDTDLNKHGEDLIRSSIVTNFVLDILFGNSSKFYNELYDEGLIDGSFGAYYSGKETYGHSLIVGESDRPREVYDRILEEIKKEPRLLIKEEDFIRVKNNEIGGFLMGLNSIEFIGNLFTEFYFSDFMMFDYLKLVESIEYDEIIDRFKSHFREDRMILSIVNPVEEV